LVACAAPPCVLLARHSSRVLEPASPGLLGPCVFRLDTQVGPHPCCSARVRACSRTGLLRCCSDSETGVLPPPPAWSYRYVVTGPPTAQSCAVCVSYSHISTARPACDGFIIQSIIIIWCQASPLRASNVTRDTARARHRGIFRASLLRPC